MYNYIRFATSLECLDQNLKSKSSLIQPFNNLFNGLYVGVQAGIIEC